MKDLQQQPFETEGHDLSGFASADIRDMGEFNLFAAGLAGYNAERFTAVAVKFFMQDNDFIVTLYALDKDAVNHADVPEGKYPVRKFKLHPSFMEFMKHIKSLDVVLTDQKHNIENMVVMNH